MGMLDDAIREHLELKRLRGADPGAVARAARDALGPVPSEAADAAEETLVGAADEEVSESGASVFEVGETPGSESDPAAAHPGQETVEMNMEAELGGDTRAAQSTAPQSTGRNAPVGHPAHTQPSAEESLEWEMPSDRADDAAAEGPADEGSVEDVLEETPDFLRDTPEQERLWFEQRPPRDFDFNE